MNKKTLDFLKTYQFDLQTNLDEGDILVNHPIPEDHHDLDDVVYLAVFVDENGDFHYSYTDDQDTFSEWVVFGPCQVYCQYNYVDGVWVQKEFVRVHLFTAVEGEDNG